jgi:hypothetical protein
MIGVQDLMEPLGLLRGAIGLVKDTEDPLPAPQREAVDQALEQTEAASKPAAINLAKELGYKIC